MRCRPIGITEKSPYFVRVSFTLPQISYVLGKYAAEHGIKTVYFIVSDYGPGLDAETWFKEGFEGAGGKVIGSARTPVSEMEYSHFLQRAVEAKPDAVFSFDPGGDVAVACSTCSRWCWTACPTGCCCSCSPSACRSPWG